MDIILRDDVDKLGTKGQMVSVAAGFARNFLIPRGLAMPATAANKKMIEDMRASFLRKEAKQVDEAKELGALLAKVTVKLTAKVGENDTLFGSVTAMDIEKELIKQNFHIERRRIQLDEPIKKTGDHKVAIRIHKDVIQEITVSVVPE